MFAESKLAPSESEEAFKKFPPNVLPHPPMKGATVMTDPIRKARLLRVCLIAGITIAALVGYVLVFASTGLGFPCVLYEYTGLQCGGCGLTRAAVSLFRLDFAAAFSYHALWPVFVAYFLWVGLSDAAVYVKTGKVRLLPGKWWIHAALLAVIVGYGILRNFL